MVPICRPIGSALLAISAISLSAHGQITLTISTDKVEYASGEAIDFHVIAHNSRSEPVALVIGAAPAAAYALDDEAFVYPQHASPLRLQQTIGGNDSFTWTVHHKWSQYVIPIGDHKMVGRLAVAEVAPSAPATFRVVAPTPPTKDFLINFETLPDSNKPIQEIEEYWPWGVRFGISKSPERRPTLAGDVANRYLACNSAKFPPGFNILAEMAMSVESVNSDVSAAAGTRVTMLAKDKEGKVLDTAVSPEVPAPGTFLPLSVESKAAPIASVEWWPSAEKSPVMIDNVRVSVSKH